MSKALRNIAIMVAAGMLLFGALMKFSPEFKRQAQIKAVDKISDVAMERMASNPETKGSVAAEFINIPIKARELSPGIWQATGVGNTHIITTNEKDIMFDTGLPTQAAKQIKVLEAAIPNLDLSHIIVSHSHADHAGGTKFWQKPGVEIVTHAEFPEEQRYLDELEAYFWHRNRTLFPFMPEEPPTIGLIAYGGVEPTMFVPNGRPLKFSQGGVDFEVHALPGAEGADNIILWLPQTKTLLAGDFLGPLFPQFPNIFTMRGEKIRKPIEYINSLNTVIALDPDMIVPSHKDPITDKAVITSGLVKIRDATQYVHDAVIAGMNAGQTMEQLMAEIALPPELALTQEHGKVSWAVKSIWEYYATWFHFDKTTELYAVPQDTIYADIIEAAGDKALTETALGYVEGGEPLKALHLVDIVLGVDPNSTAALSVREKALEQLLMSAKSGDNNSYEIYWLNYRLRDTRAAMQP